jgi:hypothetical protein
MRVKLPKVLKRLHYPLEVMLVCARWHAAYPLSLRHIEEVMHERGVFVDHPTVHRWALKIMPVLALAFRRHKGPVGGSWRVGQTYIKVAGQGKYLHRAVDKTGVRLVDTLELVRTGVFDAALLDINLNGEISSKVARVLAERGVNFVFSTGCDIKTILPAHLAGTTAMSKPFRIDEVGQNQLCDRRRMRWRIIVTDAANSGLLQRLKAAPSAEDDATSIWDPLSFLFKTFSI